MNVSREPNNIQELLDRIEKAKGDDRVSLGSVMQTVGTTSFSPLLLLAGVVTLAPVIGDIPGMPTMMGLLVFTTGLQMLFGRKHFWLPQWLLRRSVDRDKLEKGVKWMRPAARFFDRVSKQRLTGLIRESRIYAITVVCLGIALAMPVMELVPFSANAAGAALTAFGLSLISQDGVIALIAFAFSAVTFGIVVFNLV